MGHIMGPPCGVVKLTAHSDLALLEVDGSMLTFKVICLLALQESKSPQGHSTACWPFKYLSITAFNFPSIAGPLALTFLCDGNHVAAFPVIAKVFPSAAEVLVKLCGEDTSFLGGFNLQPCCVAN